MWGMITPVDFWGAELAFIISLLLSLRYKKMNTIIIIAISAVAGSLFSEIIEGDLKNLLFGRLIINGLVSLCLIGLTNMVIKIFIILRPKQLKISNFLERFFSDDKNLTIEEIKELNELPSENISINFECYWFSFWTSTYIHSNSHFTIKYNTAWKFG